MTSIPKENCEDDIFDFLVVGAGPAGVTVVGNLLDKKVAKLAWCDPEFEGGRIAKYYTEVPSNTKVRLFIDFANACQSFKDSLTETGDNANVYTKLKGLDQDKGCSLLLAGELTKSLSQGLQKKIQKVIYGSVTSIQWIGSRENEVWLVHTTNTKLDQKLSYKTRRVTFCTGSHPTPFDFKTIGVDENKMIPLEVALRPSKLKQYIDSNDTVAVVGASHSAILALRNVVQLPSARQPKKIINFFRYPLKYAIQQPDGWTLYDNTGLKGEAADWAKEHLEDANDENQKNFNRTLIPNLTRKQTTDERGHVNLQHESELYAIDLLECTKIIACIGFDKNKLPEIFYDFDDSPSASLTASSYINKNRDVSDNLKINHDTGEFYFSSSNEYASTRRSLSRSSNVANMAIHNQLHEKPSSRIRGLYGCGIAFPERVVDPLGNAELAVGMWKFMKTVKKMVPKWIL